MDEETSEQIQHPRDLRRFWWEDEPEHVITNPEEVNWEELDNHVIDPKRLKVWDGK